MSLNPVLIAEDDNSLREALGETVKLAGYQSILASSAEEALKLLEEKSPKIIISDVQMSGMDGLTLLQKTRKSHPDLPVILITAHGTINDAVKAMHIGAADYLTKPFNPELLIQKIKRFVPDISNDETLPIAESQQSRELLALAYRVAQSDVTVMISGESGTGKEVLARYIHDHSERSPKPFVAINCAAIPENMLEATLFGYEKGAFTGAYKAMPGKFEQAQGGTLLLDEISEMDMNLQVKLLRVLQEKEVERIGSQNTIELDVRVIATSNRIMLDEVKAGRFREDLYFRLNVFPLHWIPLRSRPEDILPLAHYLLQTHARERSIPVPKLSSEAETAIKNYSWPGNAREMDNVIQRALILSDDDVIEVDHLKIEVRENEKLALKNNYQHEYQIICQAFEESNGDYKKMAKLLKMNESVLKQKISAMRELGMLAE